MSRPNSRRPDAPFKIGSRDKSLTLAARGNISCEAMTQKNSLTYLVTGGAGFIGSHLLDSLLSGAEAKGKSEFADNFSSVQRERLEAHANDPRLKVHEVDLLQLDKMLPLFQDVDAVFHLAANPDARWGIANTKLDLEQETIVTYSRHRICR